MNRILTNMQLIGGIFDTLQYDIGQLKREMSESEELLFKNTIADFSNKLDQKEFSNDNYDQIQDIFVQFLQTFESIPALKSHFAERLDQLRSNISNERAGNLEYCNPDDFKVYANEIIYAVEVIDKAEYIEKD